MLIGNFLARLMPTAVLAGLASAPAAAADFTIGIGVGVAPDYEGSDDHQLLPTWLIAADDLHHPDR
jgi:outer membrane scaffolding protein for murein synthesis (MipA/OmpV family)